MNRCLALALLLSSACIVVRTPETEQPLVTDPCDADEVFGDGVDQDCDGTLNALIGTYEAPARTEALTLEWGSDLRTLGGVVELPTGILAGQSLFFEDVFGGEVTLKERSDYALPQGEIRAARLDGPIDLVADVDTLTAWDPAGSVGTAVWTGEWPEAAGLDAFATPDGVWALGCDGEAAEFVRIDLDAGETVQRGRVETPASDCVFLGEADGTPIVVLTVGTALERWTLDPIDGFTNRLVLASNAGNGAVHTAVGADQRALAFVRDGQLRIINTSGEGLILGTDVSATAFDIAIAEDGQLLAAWVDGAGTAWAAVGSPPGPVTEVELAANIGGHTVAAGLTVDEIAIAIQTDERTTFLRAVR
ncbi:MAG: hypothetical protein AB8H79_18560 [Myxococcota bacterium]